MDGDAGWGRPRHVRGKPCTPGLGKGRRLSGTITWRVDKSLCGDLGEEVSVLARI